MASHLSPWPPGFSTRWSPETYHLPVPHSLPAATLALRVPRTQGAGSQLMALALSSVRSSFPLEVAASLTSFEPQLTRHLPQVPSGDSTQRKPAHPPSWVSHHLPALLSFWCVTARSCRVALFVYVFIAYLLSTTGRGLVALDRCWCKDPEKHLVQSH